MIKVGIVILNYNGLSDTTECIKSLQKCNVVSGVTVEIVVVDNASTKDSVTEISEQFPQITVIRNQYNLGFSGGNNEGIKYFLKKKVDYIILLNNDTFVEKDYLKELLNAATRDERIGIVVPKIYFAKGYEFHKDRYKKNELGHVIWYAGGVFDWKNVIGYHRGVDEVDYGQYDKAEITDFASGCCMLIKADLLENIGLLDEKYFLYYEDSDISERTKNAGYAIQYAPLSIIWHKNAGSTGGSGSQLQDYYITRNRLLFGMRYAPTRAKLALIKESIFLLRTGRKWQKRGVIDFYIQRFGKGSFHV